MPRPPLASRRHKEARGRLAIAVEGAALLAQLPLPAGQSCSVPVTVSAGVRATHAAEELCSAEICVECVSQEAAGPLLLGGDGGDDGGTAAGAAGAAQTVLGRHAVLPVQAHVQPSLQVVQVGFRDIWLPAGPAHAAAAAAAPAGSSSSSTFERRCVMEVAVSNRGRWPLQVAWQPAVWSRSWSLCDTG